jgi:hypothetical protein
MKTMRSRFILCVVMAAVLGCLVRSHAQNAPNNVPQLTVKEESLTQYPSLEPVETIYVSLNTPDEVFSAVATAAKDPGWNCLSPQFYDVGVSNGKKARQVHIKKIMSSGNDPATNAPYTRCDGAGNPGGVNIVLGSRVDKSAKVTVKVFYDSHHTMMLAESSPLTLSSATNFTFTATPQAVPSEALTNNKSRDVGQLSLSFGETNLLPIAPLDVYINSNNDVFSTDEKDAKSAFAVAVGGQRDLLHHWYTPLQVEEGVQGNQTATNLSDTTKLNLSFITPWASTASVLNNSGVRAPLPPAISIANVYTHRINQLITGKAKALAVNDYSLNPSGSWSLITFPQSCKLIGWLNKEANSTSSCLGAAFDLGLWYLPLDLTDKHSQRVEGYGDASILIPLTAFNFASELFPYLTSSDPTKVQIQVKYTDSVNAANNYARARNWTYGLQVSK